MYLNLNKYTIEIDFQFLLNVLKNNDKIKKLFKKVNEILDIGNFIAKIDILMTER
jgi:hypothetical protein